jgi:hypothetical protein
LISGNWIIAKIAVIGVTPKALKATQKSVDWVRQMISFRIAIATAAVDPDADLWRNTR